ncbi:serine hydrolase domain-containing protein [Paenibacillus xanthanilyticus]|uniref:Serine hydrolase domain-containing protein n=1 Tax=Paenibacillus xanthanilyticus TaxID=1783531 RepID=A0ABV8K8L2_9BACL
MRTKFEEFRFIRRAMLHSNQFRPTVSVKRGSGQPAALIQDPKPMDDLVFTDDQGHTTTLAEVLGANHTDAFLVMHQGRIVYEKYFGMEPLLQHGLASVTKSFVGTLVGMELYEGRIKASDRVDQYIPELAESAFGDATIQQLLDMQISCEYPVYFPEADYIDNQRNLLLTAIGTIPAKEGYSGPRTIRQYLASIKKKQDHGTAFSYSNGPTETLAWFLSRVSSKSLADLLSEQIWSKLGAEEDAYFVVDAESTEQACGGLHVSLRDAARFAEMMRNDGWFNGHEIVPKPVIDEIRKGANADLFAASMRSHPRSGFAYHNQWWITNNRFGSYEANGLYGQRIHIAPRAEMVIVQFSTHPGHSDETARLFARAFEAIANHLI